MSRQASRVVRGRGTPRLRLGRGRPDGAAGREGRRLAEDPAFLRHTEARVRHWDDLARRLRDWRGLGETYHRRLRQVYSFLIAPGQRVLEVGAGCGDLLAACRPSEGVGIDFSPEMIRWARERHPALRFDQADAHLLRVEALFDVIVMSDLVNDVWDVQTVFERVRRACRPSGRIILNFYSRLWETPLNVAERIGLAKPTLAQNWLTVDDVRSLLDLADMEVVRSWTEFLFPLPIPGLEAFVNRVLCRLWPFSSMSLTNVVVARPKPAVPSARKSPRVSVIIPVRNEAGNVGRLVQEVPEMGGGTELIFVEGHSTDESYAGLRRVVGRRAGRDLRLLRQSGKGKGDAVRLGFSAARGDILVIYDADLTVPPVDLPRFVEAVASGRVDFANGVRLVYPMEGEAMRFLNFLGNKFFSLAFTWLLGQPVKDTLCGTKALWRRDYERIAAQRSYFGDFDPFGDFDLLFGAAKLGLRIVDIPVRYRARTYGTTNIQRWQHGWLLLRMVMFAAIRLKFV